MNRERPQNIVCLFCSEDLAIWLGAQRVVQPAASCSVMAAHRAEITSGTAICVMTAGENYVWPCGSAA